MDSLYKKEGFETLKIKFSIAEKFKEYCNELSKSPSMTLLLMVEFFERNAVSPNDIIGSQGRTLKKKKPLMQKQKPNEIDPNHYEG